MKILIVDDNRDTADTLQALLQYAGHDVRVAYRGDEALELAATFEPDLALVDIQLPDTTGFAVAQRLRKQLARRVHIVGITGGDTRSLRTAGTFNEHAVKPISAARLYQVIDAARDAMRAA